MNKHDTCLLFDSIYPSFFEKENIRNQPEEYVFDEMILDLSEYDPEEHGKSDECAITFGYYDKDLCALRSAVAAVDPDWVRYFDLSQRVFCAFDKDKVAAFCIITDMGVHRICGKELRIGGPGCVGTLPEYRNRGIGLTMVSKVNAILKSEGYDYSYIHYTHIPDWYKKMGYTSLLRWNKNGIIQSTRE